MANGQPHTHNQSSTWRYWAIRHRRNRHAQHRGTKSLNQPLVDADSFDSKKYTPIPICTITIIAKDNTSVYAFISVLITNKQIPKSVPFNTAKKYENHNCELHLSKYLGRLGLMNIPV